MATIEHPVSKLQYARRPRTDTDAGRELNPTPVQDKLDEANSPAATRVRALSEFLLDREPLLAVLAARLGACDAVFESAIRGSSMSPAIPGRARLRVRLLDRRSCERGDILFYLSEKGFMVHRVVHLPRRGPAADMLLTRGDNCLMPDAPVSRNRVLGTVIEVYDRGTWRSPGLPGRTTVYHRIAQALSLSAMVVAMRCSPRASCRLAAALQTFESGVRYPVGRLLRRLRLTSSVR